MFVLHKFVTSKSDIKELRDILSGGINPNILEYGFTALHNAVFRSNRNPHDINDILTITRELISFGANVNLEDHHYGRTPLHYAVRFRNYKMIELLLYSNADLDIKDHKGFSALHSACSETIFNGCYRVHNFDLELDIVKLLLKHNPDPDAQNERLETPLMLAVRNNKFYIVRELLKNNASVNLQDTRGNTALHYALYSPKVNLHIVTDLVRYGCAFNLKNNMGENPIELYIYDLKDKSFLEIEERKYIFKLFVFDGMYSYLNCPELRSTFEAIYKKNYEMYKYLVLCCNEIRKMRLDEFGWHLNVFEFAVRGAFAIFFNVDNHVPLEVNDKILEKLFNGQYPIYYDLIASGICKHYMRTKFAEMCCRVHQKNRNFLNFDGFYYLSLYLANCEMLNMIIALSCSKNKLLISENLRFCRYTLPQFNRFSLAFNSFLMDTRVCLKAFNNYLL